MKMKVTLLAVVGLVLAITLISITQSAASQNSNSSTTQTNANRTSPSRKARQPRVTELKANKGETSRGADPNIKQSKETNDPNATMDAPRSKGGATTRGQGGYCEVRFDNRTKWYIKLYVDGDYRGTLSPYGDAVVYALAGSTRVYARADFDDGTYLYWGPSTYTCGPNEYIPFRMLP